MGDFDARPRRARTVLAPQAVVVGVAVAAAAAGLWIGRSTAVAASPAEVPVAAGLPAPPPWPATGTPGPADGTPAAAGTVDAGQGWAVPNPGAAGPFSVTDRGVPFGYRQDSDGAALAAVNAVVAGRYLAGTFTDPWSALGFLADPQYAARGGNPTLERFFTGPVTPQVVGGNPSAAAPPAAAPPATVPSAAVPSATVPSAAAGSAAAASTAAAAPDRPAGGGRVVGVRATPAAAPDGAMRAVVLWEGFTHEYRPDGRQGYTVRIEPVSVLLVWAAGDWKVSQVGRPPAGAGTAEVDTVVVGVVPDSFPVPAESWHR